MPKILIADDERDVTDILAKKVREAGFDVVTSYDGGEAWKRIEEDSPDVIVMDLTMPVKDGLEVLKELRAKPPSSKWQPVIIVSARGELEDMKKGLSLDADHYMTKPCQPQDVIKAIRLMLALIPQRKAHNE